MTIKIISALLILLMSLACCSCDKVSRQPTAKLSGGHEDNAPSDPLQVCSPAANLTDPEPEPKRDPIPFTSDDLQMKIAEIEARRVAKEQEEELRIEREEEWRIMAHIEQIYGKDSTASEEEQWCDIENYGYTPLWLNTIIYMLDEVGKHDTPFYRRVSNRKDELFAKLFAAEDD
jgi:hypothetical protein